MPSIRTLENIVNPDLSNFLSEKFSYAKSIGVEIEIELTEPIENLIIDTEGFLKIMDRLFEIAFQAIKATDEKKLLFCMFYKDEDLVCIIRYPFITGNNNFILKNYNNKLNEVAKKYRDVINNIMYEDQTITHELIVMN